MDASTFRLSRLHLPRSFRLRRLTPIAWVWLALAAAHLVYAVWFNPRVYYAEDDVLYEIMTKSMAVDHSFYIKNGFDETRSPLFEYMYFYMPNAEGEIAAQYPPLFPVFASPFFLIFGTNGPLYFNALAFMAGVWLVFRCGLLLFDDRKVAHAGALIYATATFAQPLALLALPHTLAVTLVIAAFYCALRSARQLTLRRELDMAFCAGILEGIATGVRIDSFFALAGVAGPLVFTKRLRIKPLASFCLGLGLALLVLAQINQLRFDQFTPFSYGKSQVHPIFSYQSYIPMAVVLAAVCGCGFLYIHLSPQRQRQFRVPLLAATLIAAIGNLRFIPSWAWFHLNTILWDTHYLPSITGYAEKSLIQSCPFFILVFLGWWFAFRREERAREIYILSLVPLMFSMVYGVLGFASCIHLYQRFLSPGLPFASLIMAYVLLKLYQPQWKATLAIIAGTFTLLGALTFAVGIHPSQVMQNSYLLLRAPHQIAGVLALLGGLCIAAETMGWYKEKLFRLTGMALIAAMAWSSAVLYFKDQPALMEIEPLFFQTRNVAKLIPPHSFVLTSSDQLRGVAAFYNVPDIRVAMQPRDLPPSSDEEVLRVIHYYHLAQGRTFFTYFTDMQQAGHFLELLHKNGFKPEVFNPKQPELLQWTL